MTSSEAPAAHPTPPRAPATPHPTAFDTAPAPLPVTVEQTDLLDAFATTDATFLTLCRHFAITLGQLEAFLASPHIRASLAALQRLKTIRAPLLADIINTAALRTFRTIASACPAAHPTPGVPAEAPSPAPGGGGARAAGGGGSGKTQPAQYGQGPHSATSADLRLLTLEVRARESARKAAERMLRMTTPPPAARRQAGGPTASRRAHAADHNEPAPRHETPSRAHHRESPADLSSSTDRPEPTQPTRARPEPPPRPSDDALPPALRALYRARDAKRARREGARTPDPPA